MDAFAKRLLRNLARMLNTQIVPITAEQKRVLQLYPDLRYSHFGMQEALVMQHGQITLAEARFLGSLVASVKAPGPIVEIGTLFGWSTRVMCLFKAPERELITVDNYSWTPLGFPSQMHFETTRAIMAEAITIHNVRLERAASADFFASYKGPEPGLVFIDASHAYEDLAADIRGARSIGARVICGHDYCAEKCPGVVRAVDEVGHPTQVVDTVWVL